jgi:hypothetical protein
VRGGIDRGRRRRETGASLAPFFVRASSSLRCFSVRAGVTELVQSAA